jgi:hypothetical protein
MDDTALSLGVEADHGLYVRIDFGSATGGVSKVAHVPYLL